MPKGAAIYKAGYWGRKDLQGLRNIVVIIFQVTKTFAGYLMGYQDFLPKILKSKGLQKLAAIFELTKKHKNKNKIENLESIYTIGRLNGALESNSGNKGELPKLSN